jgi:hypothetical protein
VCASSTRKEVIRAAAAAGHQHRCQPFACFRVTRNVRAAPWKVFEKEFVVSPRRQVDRLATLDGCRLARQLGSVLTFLDHRSAFQARANVVTAALLEGGEHLVGRLQLKDPSVLRLGRLTFDESSFRKYVAELPKRLRLESQLGDLCTTRPFDKSVD